MAGDLPPAALDALAREVPDGRPIVLINLLRFRPRTSIEGSELSGREAYERYVKALEPAIMTVGGRPIWRGEARFTLIGPSAERWDEVILVAYPRRQAFERLLATREYRAAVALRSAALEDSRLIVTIAPQAIGRVAWSLYKLGAKLHRRAPR